MSSRLRCFPSPKVRRRASLGSRGGLHHVHVISAALILAVALVAALMGWEAWPLSAYPMYSAYRRPAGTRAYCLELCRDGDDFQVWRPSDHKQRGHLSARLAGIVDTVGGDATNPIASLHLEAEIRALLGRQRWGPTRARIVERWADDDACQQLREQVVCEFAWSPSVEGRA